MPTTACPRDQRLVEFAQWCIEQSWDGFDLDGGAVQLRAQELGLIERVPYDPAKHGPSEYANEGDTWFVFAGPLGGK